MCKTSSHLFQKKKTESYSKAKLSTDTFKNSQGMQFFLFLTVSSISSLLTTRGSALGICCWLQCSRSRRSFVVPDSNPHCVFGGAQACILLLLFCCCFLFSVLSYGAHTQPAVASCSSQCRLQFFCPFRFQLYSYHINSTHFILLKFVSVYVLVPFVQFEVFSSFLASALETLLTDLVDSIKIPPQKTISIYIKI